jgi:WD40 repeat protein
MPRKRVARRTRLAIDPIWQASLDDFVIDARWSPDGTLIAAAAVSGPVSILDAESGRVRWSAHAHGFGTTEVVWHPEVELLTTAGQDGTLRNWSPASGEELGAMDGGGAWVEHIAWSPNGKLLGSAAGKRLRLWDTTGAMIREYDNHESTIADIAWEPGGGNIVSGAYGGLRFWNVSSAEAVRTFEWRGSILTIAWSPDGKYIATGDQDSTVHFWMVKTGKDLQMWGYPTKVRELAWNSGGTLLATGGGPTVAVWDCSGRGPEGRAPILLEAHEEVLTSLAFHPELDVLASADQSGHVALWEPRRTRDLIEEVAVDGEVSVMQWSPDGRALLVATETGSLDRIDVHWEA